MHSVPDTRTKLLDTAMEIIWENSYSSVSVDQMCERAGIKKGSFYHFFKSKSDLAVAAFERCWELKQPKLELIFSCQVAPAERLKNYLQYIVDGQMEKFKSYGRILGCPYCSIGSELSTQDENIRLKADEMSERALRYVTTAVRDLVEARLIEVDDIPGTAKEVYLYLSGVLLQAKIKNDPELLRQMGRGVNKLLGLRDLALPSQATTSSCGVGAGD